MSSFDDFGFDKEPKVESSNNSSRNFADTTETMKEVTQALKDALNPYKTFLINEFNSLDRNNEKWKMEHNGEKCKPFEEKMWAIAAPFNAIKIFTRLYINRERKDN